MSETDTSFNGYGYSGGLDAKYIRQIFNYLNKKIF